MIGEGKIVNECTLLFQTEEGRVVVKNLIVGRKPTEEGVVQFFKKSNPCEEGGAHLRISFQHLLMNLKNK